MHKKLIYLIAKVYCQICWKPW